MKTSAGRIMSKAAWTIILNRARATGTPRALLFPEWTRVQVSHIVKAVSAMDDTGLWWFGSHNVRHGVAVEARVAVEAGAKAVGGIL